MPEKEPTLEITLSEARKIDLACPECNKKEIVLLSVKRMVRKNKKEMEE